MVTICELMVGNWVKNQNGRPERIVDIPDVRVQSQSTPTKTANHHLAHFSGIDLTLDIVKKAGFERGVDSKIMLPLKKDKYTCYLWLEFIDDRVYLLTADDGHDYHLVDDIQHLHRLQNIYFAITGQQLRVDLY